MAKSEQQRQKKLARKRSKDIVKRRQLAAEKNSMNSLSGQISNALLHPIGQCHVYGSLFESGEGTGLGSVLLCRPIKDGRVVFACFLVDKDCLGVKDAFARLINPGQFSEHLQQLSQRDDVRSCDPIRAKKLVTEAVKWSASLGLQPMGDYNRVKAIWSDLDETQCEETFEFGRDGRPVYIQGPNDSPEFIQGVMNTLEANLGEDNFHYMREFGTGEEAGLDPSSLEFDANGEFELPDGTRLTRIDSSE